MRAPGPLPGLLSRRARLRIAAAVALLTAVGAVAGAVLESSGPSGSGTADAASTVTGAATVERRDLVATDTESGTLSYADPQTVYNRLSGTITWLPAVGQVIKPGGTLYRIDGRPVILMDGSTPAFRDLGPADAPGQDILELNRNLVRLGFDPEGIVVDDIWQAATTAGVDVLQASLGETETGILSLGQVVFLPGEQLVSAVDGTLGGDGSGGGSGGGGSASSAHDRAAVASPAFVSFEKPVATPRRPATTVEALADRREHGSTGRRTGKGGAPASSGGGAGHGGPSTSSSGGRAKGGSSGPRGHSPARPPATGEQELQALLALLRAEEAQVKAERAAGARSAGASHSSSPSSSSSHAPSSAGTGSGGSTPTAILQTTSTRLVATVDLDPSKQSEARVGEKVTVEMPNGTTVRGRISAVSAVAQTSSNGNGNGGGGSGGGGNGSGASSSAIPVTVALHGHHAGAGLDQAAVSVNFVQAVADNVLSVPVTALLATSGGRYAVQEATAPHKLIQVTTGLFAAGSVQISGAGIYPGLQVTDSQG